MRVVFFAVAAFCVLYYFILAVYSRKFTSTFAGFWLAAGGVHLVLGCVPPFSVAGESGCGCLSRSMDSVFLRGNTDSVGNDFRWKRKS